MGLYLIKCPTCGKEHMWWSDNLDQRCAECKATDGKRNKRNIFEPVDFELCKGELTEERMTQRAAHLANNRLASLGIDAETLEKLKKLELDVALQRERAAEWEELAIKAENRLSELETARVAYASEFDGDVGSVHQNIRALKQCLAELERMIAEAPVVEEFIMEVAYNVDDKYWKQKTKDGAPFRTLRRARLVKIEVLTK